MDYQPLDIKDSERSTRGGPPGWLAFSAILASVSIIVVVAFIASIMV